MMIIMRSQITSILFLHESYSIWCSTSPLITVHLSPVAAPEIFFSVGAKGGVLSILRRVLWRSIFFLKFSTHIVQKALFCWLCSFEWVDALVQLWCVSASTGGRSNLGFFVRLNGRGTAKRNVVVCSNTFLSLWTSWQIVVVSEWCAFLAKAISVTLMIGRSL